MSEGAKPEATLLGRYELLHELGYGGMASVHLARVPGPADFTKWLAVKRIHPRLAREREFIDMFLDEARIAASLQHPHVAAVFELGQEGDEYFLAMEYLHGEHLGTVMRRAADQWGHIPAELSARIIANAADGLHHAHEARDAEGKAMGLVHRDVSPQNIFVTYDGQVKLTDFGIAKAAGRLTNTATGHMKGKIAYMAPEQALSQTLDRRSDIFALGVVLWEIAVGQRLFKAESDVQTLMRITSGNVPLPSEKRPGFPPALEKIIVRALSMSPDDRYANAAAMARDLDRFVAQSGKPAGPSEIADRMRSLFAEEMAERNVLLREAAEQPNLDVTPTPRATLQRAQPAEPQRRRLGLIVAGLALAAIGGSALALSGLGTTELETASPRIITSPAGARVWIDEEEAAGRTPITLEAVRVGRHALRLELEGYEALRTNFDADSADTAPLSYTLRPRAAVPVAIPSTPEPEAREPDVVESVATETPRTTSMGMRRRPRMTEMTTPEAEPVGEPASLTVISLPWASASIDNQRARQTPLRGVRLSPGSHTIRYQVQGTGPERTQQVRLEAGERRTLRLNTQ